MNIKTCTFTAEIHEVCNVAPCSCCWRALHHLFTEVFEYALKFFLGGQDRRPHYYCWFPIFEARCPVEYIAAVYLHLHTQTSGLLEQILKRQLAPDANVLRRRDGASLRLKYAFDLHEHLSARFSRTRATRIVYALATQEALS